MAGEFIEKFLSLKIVFSKTSQHPSWALKKPLLCCACETQQSHPVDLPPRGADSRKPLRSYQAITGNSYAKAA
jgi:hypothetical protein